MTLASRLNITIEMDTVYGVVLFFVFLNKANLERKCTIMMAISFHCFNKICEQLTQNIQRSCMVCALGQMKWSSILID